MSMFNFHNRKTLRDREAIPPKPNKPESLDPISFTVELARTFTWSKAVYVTKKQQKL